MLKEKFKGIDWKNIGVLLFLFLMTIIFWNSVIFYPVKLFVVLLHEISHGLAAILTGGRISQIVIDQQLGGVCYTLGGIHFFILCAGYLGSMLWGGIILIIASRTKYDAILAGFIGGILILIAALYIRTLFGLAFTIGFGIALIAIAKFAHAKVTDFLMKFLGMTSCLYAIIDIKEDLIDRTVPGSDAYMIAKMIGFPSLSIVIGILWIIFALIVFLWVLKKCSSKTAP